MSGRGRWEQLAAGVAAVALVAGCGSATSGPPSTGPGAGPTSSPTVATTATSSPEVWDLVWFSDSSASLAALWASRIEAVNGVQVRVHDFWGPSIRGSASFIGELTEVEAVEQAIVEAEVIGLYANPARTTAGDELGAACAFDIGSRTPPAYTARDFAEYADQLRFIYDRIFELRGGRTAIIRAVDAYVPILAEWRTAGIEKACTAGWEAWTSVARTVAADYGVPMASIYDAFNGPGHDQNPADKGYIGEDGAHPSDAGSAAQVAVLDALGYEPVTRPYGR